VIVAGADKEGEKKKRGASAMRGRRARIGEEGYPSEISDI